MKKLLIAFIALSMVSLSAVSQNSVDSTTYENNVNTRFKRGVPRKAVLNMFLETHKAAFLYGYRGDFADSTTLATDIPSPFVFSGYRPFATVGTSIFIWSGSAWTPVSGSGGGSPAVNHNGDFTGDGTVGNPLGLANDAVGSPEISADAVGSSELADNAVSSSNIVDASVSTVDIALNAIDSTLLYQLKPNQFLWNATGVLANAQRGTILDLTEDSTPVTGDYFVYHSVGNGIRKINVDDMPGGTITSGLNVGSGEFGWFKQVNGSNLEFYTFGNADNTISIVQQSDSLLLDIAANSIVAGDIATDGVTASEIAANAVGNSEMADNAIGAAEIINGSITEADINNNELINIFDNPPTVYTADSIWIDDTDVPDRFDLGIAHLNPIGKQIVTIDQGVANDQIEFHNLSTDSISFIAGSGVTLADPGFIISQDQYAFLKYVTPTYAILKIEGSGGGGGGAGTNLSINRSASQYLVQSSTGTDVDLPEATTGLRGLLSSADKTKLDQLVPSVAPNYVLMDVLGLGVYTPSLVNSASIANFSIATEDINNNQVDSAKLFDFPPTSILMRSVNSTGDSYAFPLGDLNINSTTLDTDLFVTLADGGNEIKSTTLNKITEHNKVSSAEIVTGSETDTRHWSVQDVHDMIDQHGSGAGETNLMQNSGLGGVGVYDNKSGVTFNMRNINADATATMNIALDAGNNEIDIGVAAGSIGALEIGTGAVGSLEISDGSITDVDIGNGAINNAKIATNAVESDNIAPNVIVEADLADNNNPVVTIVGNFTLDENDITHSTRIGRFYVNPPTADIVLTLDQGVANERLELTNIDDTYKATFSAGAGVTMIGTGTLDPGEVAYVEWESATVVRYWCQEGGGTSYGPWNNVTFMADWSNYLGTAKWRSVYIDGDHYIQYNGAIISYTGTAKESSAFQDFSGLFDITYWAYQPVVASTALHADVYVISADVANDDMAIRTQDATKTFSNGFRVSLPTSLYPVVEP